MDIFSHLLVVRIVKFVEKGKNKQKRGRGWPFLRSLRDRIRGVLMLNKESIVLDDSFW